MKTDSPKCHKKTRQPATSATNRLVAQVWHQMEVQGSTRNTRTQQYEMLNDGNETPRL